MKIKSILLVFLQLLFVFLFLPSGPLIAKNIYLHIIELLAGVLGVWAIVLMSVKSRFSGFPAPKQNARLLETGPYRYIRNPMYTAIILAMGALVADYFTPVRLVLFLLEAAVLMSKISIEEKLLQEKFKGYAAYKSRTKRLIPFVY